MPGLAGLATNDGPHGLTEILFAFATSFGNNGQAFAGLNAYASFYNVGTVIAMMAGRFALVRPGRTETLEMCNSGQNMSALFTIVHALRVNHDCT